MTSGYNPQLVSEGANPLNDPVINIGEPSASGVRQSSCSGEISQGWKEPILARISRHLRVNNSAKTTRTVRDVNVHLEKLTNCNEDLLSVYLS